MRHIRVVTGASGGSIIAALLAIKTEQELMDEVLNEDLTTDYKVCAVLGQHHDASTRGRSSTATFPSVALCHA
jgi:predicted acylesterase/phospholipase RssA